MRRREALGRRHPTPSGPPGRGIRGENRAISLAWLGLAAFGVAAFVGGCSGGDPPPRITAHSDSSGAPAGATPPPSGGGALLGDAGAASNTADAGTSYRDPAAGDGACSLPNMVCAGACVAVGHDVDHCGSCDNKCLGDTADCIGGKCACGTGFDYCSNAGCMDIATDTNNCGACGNVCDPNQFDACVGGQCTTTQ